MSRQIKQAQVAVGMTGVSSLRGDARLLDEIRLGDWLHVELEDDGTSRDAAGWITYYVRVGGRSGHVRIPPSDKTQVEIQWNDAPHEAARRKPKARARG